jgi:hypothetical protein
MRIIFLNTFHGKVRDGISQFLKDQSLLTDIFCFQEFFEDMDKLYASILPNFQPISVSKEINLDSYRQTTLINKGLKIKEWSVFFPKDPNKGLGIFTRIEREGQNINIVNLHGQPKPGDKLDNPERLAQSQQILDHINKLTGLKIIGGDFNLFPETQSINLFEKAGFRNLIKDYSIHTTRNRLAWEPYPDNPQLFSDYVFVSPEIRVKEFTVPDIEISDHLPMILTIDIHE